MSPVFDQNEPGTESAKLERDPGVALPSARYIRGDRSCNKAFCETRICRWLSRAHIDLLPGLPTRAAMPSISALVSLRRDKVLPGAV